MEPPVDIGETEDTDRVDSAESREKIRFPNRGFGIDRGCFEVPDDFDDPLPSEIMRYFT